MTVFLLSDTLAFPPPHLAGKEGLLAVGGDLSLARLLLAYRSGIFPWYAEGEPILWWSPDPRLVLYPDELKVSKSLDRLLRKNRFTITADTAFEEVISACAETAGRKERGTWIVGPMKAAYCRLHSAGYAHSIETRENGRLVGGLYGVSIGKCFFGESMFSLVSNASKVALVHLTGFLRRHEIGLIDCQVPTRHLISLGAREITRDLFLKQLAAALREPTIKGNWKEYWHA